LIFKIVEVREPVGLVEIQINASLRFSENIEKKIKTPKGEKVKIYKKDRF